MQNIGENTKKKMWKIKQHKKISIKNPVLLEGLPGIANVGKIVADYLIDQLKADLIYSVFSYDLPNSVFVNEHNLVELPKIEIYHKKINGKDYLFLAGDVQPASEQASYTFCNKMLDLVQDMGCKEIITLGGIGLQEVPIKPNVYCTGNDVKLIKKFTDLKAKSDVYGLVGPIIGVSGLLIGLSIERKMRAAALLAETYGHPMYLGLSGAKSTLKVLSKAYKFEINFREINKEIKLLEKELSGEEVSKKIKPLSRLKKIKETSYIG